MTGSELPAAVREARFFKDNSSNFSFGCVIRLRGRNLWFVLFELTNHNTTLRYLILNVISWLVNSNNANHRFGTLIRLAVWFILGGILCSQRLYEEGMRRWGKKNFWTKGSCDFEICYKRPQRYNSSMLSFNNWILEKLYFLVI